MENIQKRSYDNNIKWKPILYDFILLRQVYFNGYYIGCNSYSNMEHFELEILKKMYIVKKMFPSDSTEKDKEEIAILRERITYLKTQLKPAKRIKAFA